MGTSYVITTGDDIDFPLEGPITVGRHLDNDLMLAGEDIKDYHLRLQVSIRGPRMNLLRGAVVRLNTQTIDCDVELVPGDVIAIGQETLKITHTPDQTERMDKWSIHGFDNAFNVEVGAGLTVGRHGDSGLLLNDGHVSRHHARLNDIDGTLWVQDLGSANGTFINGKRIMRAARLMHGDEIAFDTVSFQVIANRDQRRWPNVFAQQGLFSGRDLTEVRRTDQAMFGPDSLESPTVTGVDMLMVETPEVAAAEPSELAEIARPRESGCFLVGLSDEVSGRREVLEPGRYSIGRHHDADILIDHPSVSNRHAEISLRSEGCFISDLMSTNGVLINGIAIQSEGICDGDVVSFGSVQWVFHKVDAQEVTRVPEFLQRFRRKH